MMAHDKDNAFFARLITPMLEQLRRIARGTRGEHSIDDLKAEAWIAAHDIQHEEGIEFEPEDDGFQQAILSKLRKTFGKFANRKMRFALQLDHEQPGNDGEFLPNSVAASLAGPQSYEPEVALELAEERAVHELCLIERFTEAVAYLRTFSHFDHDKRAIATYLAIPMSTLETRLRCAERIAASQRSIFDRVEVVPLDFMPRRGRVRSVPRRVPTSWRLACTPVDHCSCACSRNGRPCSAVVTDQ
jgi:hypothetical protein